MNKEGIKANPDKVEVLLQMNPPSNIKEVQRVNGRLVAL